MKQEEDWGSRRVLVSRSRSTGFCSTCGSPALNEHSVFPGNFQIHATTLGNRATFDSMTVVFTDSGSARGFINSMLVGPKNK